MKPTALLPSLTVVMPGSVPRSMGTRLRSVLFSLLILFCITLHAQKTYKHNVFWGRLILSDNISDKWKWELYGQKRTQNIPGHKSLFGGPHFLSAWLWFSYQMNKEVKLSVSPFGYFD